MRRVTYKSVLEKASSLVLGNPVPNAKTAAALNVHLNKRAGECWESFFWSEWTVIEERPFREVWNATDIYSKGAQRFYRPTNKYYIAIRAVLANTAPNSDVSRWGELASAYDAADYVSTKQYVPGDRAKDPLTGKVYQSAATQTGVHVTDAFSWGELPRFVRNIDLEQSWQTVPIGEFKNIWDDNVEANPDACEVPFILGTDGAAIVGSLSTGLPALVWAQFRKRVPAWTGDTFVAATHATATAGTQVYDNTLGDYYAALVNNPGATLTDTTKWQRIDFPYVFRDAVPQLAYADALRGDGMNEKAWQAEVAEGFRCLRREFDKIERQQKQHRRLNVRVRK